MIGRRTFLKLAAAGAFGAAAAPCRPAAGATSMAMRRVPRTGELLPVIGMGSSGTFDVGETSGQRAPLLEVLRELRAGGGRIIDTSPMYGRSEQVLGELVAALRPEQPFWIATKVWTRGRDAGERQIAESMRLLRAQRLDLLQIHNLLDWREHLPTVRALQDGGKVRYSGITHYRADAHAELERVLRAEHFDWLQVNYSLAEQEAADRLLPYCLEHGIAVMVNRPFADGAMFGRVRDQPLPGWAEDIGCATWGQFFLKYVVSHPAVTCVIPATSKPAHMRDNCLAGLAPMPDEAQRKQMRNYWASL